jgi:hypothetical protein
MATIYVQFTDSTETTIRAAFTNAQNATAYPNQGTVTDSDPRWATFYDAIPIGAQSGWPTPVSN